MTASRPPMSGLRSRAGRGQFGAVIASEYLKVRTVRSSYGLLIGIAAMMLLGIMIEFGMTNDWNSSPPQEQAAFAAADASVLVIPFAMFCMAALGALAATSEFGTGMIRPSLVAVPLRRSLVAGKAIVVAAVTLAVGQLVAFGTYVTAWLIAGDLPAPIWPYESFSGGLATVASNGLGVGVAGLVGLGIGLVVRSTAGALISLGALLFILPTMSLLIPAPWGTRVASVMLTNLPNQLAGTSAEGLLSPLGALVAMIAQVVIAMGAGAFLLAKRDA
jgi:ABC-2 type transport system permease protein